MSSTQSPNMLLIIPGVGSEAGPQYAQDINDSLTLIDAHDHTAGQGVPITPLAMNINVDLTLQGNALTNAKYVNLTAQTSLSVPASVYAKGVDLFYIDGNGNDIRLTQAGNIAGATGSISGLTPPASVTYISVSKVFVFQSAASVAANLDAASLLMRNITPNSTFALTLQPPASLSSNYSITLPTLPSSNRVLSLSSSGVMAAGVASAIITADIADGQVTYAKLAADAKATIITTTFNTSGSVVVPTGTGIQWAFITGCGPGGGGASGGHSNGGASSNTGGGGGGGGAPYISFLTAVAPGQTLNVTLGTPGTGGAASSGNGNAGGNGTATTITATSFDTIYLPGGYGGNPGLSTSGGRTAGARSDQYLGGSKGAQGGAPGQGGGTGEINLAGLPGTAGTSSGANSGGGGGSGGAGFFGVSGSGGDGNGGGGNAGSNGIGFGSGGGGSSGCGTSASDSSAGGNGGPSFVRISWVAPA